MITINLKPGSRRAGAGAKFASGMSSLKTLPARVKDPWPMAAILVSAVTVIGLAFIGLGSAAKINSLEDRLTASRAENRRYRSFLVEKQRATAAKDSIVAQIATIRTVDGDRYTWPHVLDEVTRALPPFTWLTALTSVAAPAAIDTTAAAVAPPVQLQMLGRTMDIQGFTRFMRQLEDSPWLQDVALVTTTTEIDHGRAVTAFTVRATYVKQSHDRAPSAAPTAGDR